MAGLGLARLGKELKMLTDEPPPGVCAWPVDDCITHLQAREYFRVHFYECFGNGGPGYSLRLQPPEGLSVSPGLLLAACALITLCFAREPKLPKMHPQYERKTSPNWF